MLASERHEADGRRERAGGVVEEEMVVPRHVFALAINFDAHGCERGALGHLADTAAAGAVSTCSASHARKTSGWYSNGPIPPLNAIVGAGRAARSTTYSRSGCAAYSRSAQFSMPSSTSGALRRAGFSLQSLRAAASRASSVFGCV